MRFRALLVTQGWCAQNVTWGALTDHLLPIDVKATTRVTLADARRLRMLLADYKAQAPAALLVIWRHRGRRVERSIFAAPWHRGGLTWTGMTIGFSAVENATTREAVRTIVRSLVVEE